jgi:hypothetical protein
MDVREQLRGKTVSGFLAITIVHDSIGSPPRNRIDWRMTMHDVVAALEHALAQARMGELTGCVLVEFDRSGAYNIRVEGSAADRLTYSIGAVCMARAELQDMLQARRAGSTQPIRLSVVRAPGA